MTVTTSRVSIALASETIGADELAAWLRLTETPGVGSESCRALLAAFGLPEEIFAASGAQLARIVPQRIAAALRAPPDDKLLALTERTLTWAQQPGNHVVTLGDDRYPPLLLEIGDPPPLLYVKGRVALLATPSLAIVGSRNATAQGLIDARRFAEALVVARHSVVSGLALGIDAAAHEGALNVVEASGAQEIDDASTIAVIGTGADIVYPAANRSLAHRIAERGAIVSEFVLGSPAAAHHFPRRNRIIAGLARGVLVVEAAAQSGSLITARLAGESGREVFAIPGSIHSPLSKGCHRLIKQGAKLVESVADILEELRVTRVAAPESVATAGAGHIEGDAGEDALLATLGYDPLTVDALAMRAGLSAAELAGKLLELELAGRVARLPGGRVQRLA